MSDFYESLPVFAQNLACTWAGYRRSRIRFTPHFHRMLAEWERSVRAPVEELHAIQHRRLEHLLRNARAHVPHYADLPPPCDAPDAEEALARTLAAIPPLEKATYRDRTQDFVARNIPRRRLIQGKTSGTTGTALKLWWTPEALAEEFASVWRGRRTCGVQLDDPQLTVNGQVIVPYGRAHPPFWRTNHWNRQTLFSLYHMSPENLPAYVDAMHAAPAAFAQGYPSGLFLVARSMLDAGRPLPAGRLKVVCTSSESLLAFQRETIESGFGAPIQDRYGVSELCVSMIECPEHRLHVDMEFCLVEVETQEESRDWERGPLLVTGFANEATPLIRYRIGDVGTRAKTPCPCGRPGDSFLEIDGRIEDYVMTPDGRLVGRLDHIFKAQLDVAEAQILQEDRSALEVRVVRKPSYNEASEKKLLDEFRARLGATMRVEFRYVEAIPRESNGKFRAVKSKIGSLHA